MNDPRVERGFGSELLTVPEAAQLLRISRNLAYELVARQELPAIRLGRVIRIPRAALDEWMEQQATFIDGTPPPASIPQKPNRPSPIRERSPRYSRTQDPSTVRPPKSLRRRRW
jgi:excisionase family DNA binding protein